MTDVAGEPDPPWERAAETAFPGMAAWLQSLLADATLDRDGMQSRIHVCILADCRGACCCDGAYLEADEAAILQQLVEDRREELQIIGVDLTSAVITTGSKRRSGLPSSKTATRTSPDQDGRPATACAFWLADGRCALQVLGDQSGRHPWYFKPVACWLHPLDVDRSADGTRVGLFCGRPPADGTPSIGSAPCSQRSADGPRAIDALAGELSFLKGITAWKNPGETPGELSGPGARPTS